MRFGSLTPPILSLWLPLQLCRTIGFKRCAFGLTDGLNEAGLGVTLNWDTTVTTYLNYLGTKDESPRRVVAFTVGPTDHKARL